jgi:hypothetical protein
MGELIAVVFALMPARFAGFVVPQRRRRPVDLHAGDAQAKRAQIVTFRLRIRGRERPRAQQNLTASGRQHEGEPRSAQTDRLHPQPIDANMRIRLVRHPAAAIRQARQQPRFGRHDRRPARHERQAGVGPAAALEVGMGVDEGAAVDEGRAVAGVEIGFRRQSLREEDRVRVKLDVPIFDLRAFDLRDGDAVGERTDRDQRALKGDTVLRAQPEIAHRRAFAERASANAVRPYRARLGMAQAIDLAMTDPPDRPARTRSRDDEIADA